MKVETLWGWYMRNLGSTFEALWGHFGCLDSIAASVDLIKHTQKIFLLKVKFGHFRDTTYWELLGYFRVWTLGLIWGIVLGADGGLSGLDQPGLLLGVF